MMRVRTFVSRRRVFFLSLCVLALISTGIVFVSTVEGGAGSTDPILEIDNDTLTSYLYTSASGVQNIFPRVDQRGVGLDGTLRVRAALPIALNGNPFERGFRHRSSGIRESNGTAGIHAVDLRLPAKGFSWEVSRSYNGRQIDDLGAHHDSNGYQGKNWFNNAQPEIVLYQGATNWTSSAVPISFRTAVGSNLHVIGHVQ